MPTDIDVMKKVFNIHDVYGFGEINQKEFRRFLSALTVNTTITKSSAIALFDKVDQDRIKAITWNQFAKYMIDKKKILWKLLLELAREHDLGINNLLEMYQTTLSKIHKLILIMHEMYEQLLNTQIFCNQIDIWEDKMVEYIQWIKANQRIIDEKMVHYRENKKCKNRKYLEKTSHFIHNNMPDIDYNNI